MMPCGYDRTMDPRLIGEATAEELAREQYRPARISALHQHGRRVKGLVRTKCTRCGKSQDRDVSFFEESRRRPRCCCGGIIAAMDTVGMS